MIYPIEAWCLGYLLTEKSRDANRAKLAAAIRRKYGSFTFVNNCFINWHHILKCIVKTKRERIHKVGEFCLQTVERT